MWPMGHLLQSTGGYSLKAIGVSTVEYGAMSPLGSYEAPLIWDETTNNRNERAACIEFRCPGRVMDGNTTLSNAATRLRVQILSNDGYYCNITDVVTGLNVNRYSGPLGDGFEFRADPNDNYGSGLGVFIRTLSLETAESTCRTGLDSPNLSQIMKPNMNPSVEFECFKL